MTRQGHSNRLLKFLRTISESDMKLFTKRSLITNKAPLTASHKYVNETGKTGTVPDPYLNLNYIRYQGESCG